MLHAILVDDNIEKIVGKPDLANYAIWNHRNSGHVSEYLFSARSEEEFERKRKVSQAQLPRQGASAR